MVKGEINLRTYLSVTRPDQLIEIFKLTSESKGEYESIFKGKAIKASRESKREILLSEVRMISAVPEQGEKAEFARLKIWIVER